MSIVHYPNDIFVLEKTEILPYERCAYNVLHAGTQILRTRGFPDRLNVIFEGRDSCSFPWLIDFSISPEIGLSGDPIEFNIHVTDFSPAIIFGLCYEFGLNLTSNGNLKHWHENIPEFKKKLEQFGALYVDSAQIYASRSLNEAIRHLFSELEITWESWVEGHGSDHFDLITKLIGNHEIAHAAMGQFSEQEEDEESERCFEFLADALAVKWFYTKLIDHTPDTDEYRAFRNHTNYEESIFQNSLKAIDIQMHLLIVFGFAKAMINHGETSFSQTRTHPNAFSRVIMQSMIFINYLMSNNSKLIKEDQASELMSFWQAILSLLYKSGFVPLEDIEAGFNKAAYRDLDRAEALIEKYDINPLKATMFEAFFMDETDNPIARKQFL